MTWDGRLSVVVCTRDRAMDLVACLQSIGEQSRQPDEVVVVIGSAGSIDREACERVLKCALIVAESFEPNISKSRNVGLGIAKGDFVVFIDDDAVARGGWVEGYVKAIEQHPEAWAFGGDVFDSRTSPMETEFSKGGISVYGKQVEVNRSNDGSLPSRFVRNVKGCNFAVHRERVIGVGGFDPFFAFAFDESDLMVSIHEAGGDIVHVHESVVDHAHTPGHFRSASRFDRDWRVEFASHTMFMLKHAHGMRRVIGWAVILRRCCKFLVWMLWGVVSNQTGFRRGVRSLGGAAGGVCLASRSKMLRR
jgi:GT2 family glycosyltransferase